MNVSKILLGVGALGAGVYGLLTKAELYPNTPKVDPNKKHILCIGDSLTYGSRYQLTPDKYSYPACLNKLVQEKHPDWEVLNFGLSGRTIDINGDFPYMKEKLYRESLKVPADVVVIMFGGNDAKHCNVIGGISSMLTSYKELVKSYKEANPKCKIICMIPYKPEVYNYDMSVIGTEKVRHEQLELFCKLDIFRYYDLQNVVWTEPNLYHFFSKDGVHPTREGCYLIASYLFNNAVKGLVE